MKNSTLFASIPTAPADPILGVTEKFVADTNPRKVNLGVGIYQNRDGKAVKLDVVRKAESKILETDIAAGYVPIDGTADFQRVTQELVFGNDSQALRDKRVTTVNTPGGTGGIRLTAELLKLFFPEREVWISDPSWDNHRSIFEEVGLKVQLYPYYDSAKKGLNFEKCFDALSRAKDGTAVLLHACCHNPTGSDFSKDEWKAIFALVQKKSFIPIIDIAYQGFSQSLVDDASSVRLFAESGVSCFVISSFSKNFGIYSERTGALSVVAQNKEEAGAIRTQCKKVIRTIYSSPPSRGPKIVQAVITDPILKADWETEVSAMRTRMKVMREKFVSKLAEKDIPEDFSHVLSQHGMFSYTGIKREVILWLRENRGVYALESGRVCVAALNENNIEYVCESIGEAYRSV